MLSNLNSADRTGVRKELISTIAPVKRDLSTIGFAHFTADQLEISGELNNSFERFKAESFDNLPLDEYAPDRTRFRRHTRFVMLPWVHELFVRPCPGYFQNTSLNRVNGGQVRKFASLTPTMIASPFLRELIEFDLKHLPFSDADLQFPLDVGIHLVKMLARPERPGVSSPNELHKDGEPFTAIHLLSRCDVSGGENLVTDNHKRLLCEVTLAAALDTLIVRDSEVYHHVNPIHVISGKDEGYRVVLLIDFTPMKPQVQTYGLGA